MSATSAAVCVVLYGFSAGMQNVTQHRDIFGDQRKTLLLLIGTSSYRLLYSSCVCVRILPLQMILLIASAAVLHVSHAKPQQRQGQYDHGYNSGRYTPQHQFGLNQFGRQQLLDRQHNAAVQAQQNVSARCSNCGIVTNTTL